MAKIRDSREYIHLNEWMEESALQERMRETFDGDSENVLDNYYYNLAKRFFAQYAQIYGELVASEYGKNFILRQEEVKRFLEFASCKG